MCTKLIVQYLLSFYQNCFLQKKCVSFFRNGYAAASKLFKTEDLNVNITGRSFVITGANSGLGKATALALAGKGGILLTLPWHKSNRFRILPWKIVSTVKHYRCFLYCYIILKRINVCSGNNNYWKCPWQAEHNYYFILCFFSNFLILTLLLYAFYIGLASIKWSMDIITLWLIKFTCT